MCFAEHTPRVTAVTGCTCALSVLVSCSLAYAISHMALCSQLKMSMLLHENTHWGRFPAFKVLFPFFLPGCSWESSAAQQPLALSALCSEGLCLCVCGFAGCLFLFNSPSQNGSVLARLTVLSQREASRKNLWNECLCVCLPDSILSSERERTGPQLKSETRECFVLSCGLQYLSLYGMHNSEVPLWNSTQGS